MSNAIRQILRDASALAQTTTYRVLGETISYTFQNGTTIDNVICLPVGDNPRIRVPGASIQDKELTFNIPINSTWPLTNTPKSYDLVEYNSESYWVKSANWDNLASRWKVVVMKRENI